MILDRRTVGQLGDRLAEHYLTELGARLLARNYRIPFGEIDLVYMHEGELVAVEVKTRTVDELAQPEEAVNWRKLRCIVQALTSYAADTGYLELPWRIDVVAIELEMDGGVRRLNHLPSVYPA
jgi:putative endonuclease